MALNFQMLFKILKKHMADGDAVPYFFRELMAMITTVAEEEWGTSKDPSKKMKDETLRNYSKRGLSKTLAKNIVYRLTPEFLTERINERNETQRKLLAEDLQSYDSTINAENVGEKVSELMVSVIQQSAGLVSQSKLEAQQQAQLALDLKNQYGNYLLAEAENTCPFPGCGRSLVVTANHKAASFFEVGLIDKNGKASPENLLAMCPCCYATYSLDDNKKKCKELKAVKKTLLARRQIIQMLDELPLERGIVGVVTRIKKLQIQDFEEVSFDPKELTKKINPSHEHLLYLTVKNFVLSYFVTVREIMMNLDKRGEIDYESLQNQIHAIYRGLSKRKKNQMEIFAEIAEKIHRQTLQEIIYCQVVVSYFIQSCEVFDAITE